ncbi:LOW QUALITY PROTEIN: hypothetical protein KUTeg_020073 [Tegillarca granosa]|uniref:Transmembrane protein 5 n=1 Tax=Tegillarca granosa TaxID=220873 RepID=A0ABQ9E6P3_TEGGR|nr:LOW QUALITY PROTEIN: hypothetical protein KUTeg_020073 [Tegillarca granosa]
MKNSSLNLTIYCGSFLVLAIITNYLKDHYDSVADLQPRNEWCQLFGLRFNYGSAISIIRNLLRHTVKNINNFFCELDQYFETKQNIIGPQYPLVKSLYLWEHIFNAELERRLGEVWSYGVKNIANIEFRFRTGPGVIISKVPKTTQNLVLILNGREESKINYSKQWLNFLSNLPKLKNVAVVLLGNEECLNDWIHPYLKINGGIVKFVFLVYDSPEIDNKVFYQWPLGVATYRYFPKVDSAYLPTATHRKYVCNFLGTIYKNSSREVLMKMLENGSYSNICYIKARTEWLPQETEDTREDYLRALAKSDLTLNPVGKNTECYRIYEAISYGSIPVIEDVMTPGHCGKSSVSETIPLRLLKEERAPVIYIKNWDELTNILNKELLLSQEDKAKRRRDLILWYESFKSKMRDKFVQAIEERFFDIHRRFLNYFQIIFYFKTLNNFLYYTHIFGPLQKRHIIISKRIIMTSISFFAKNPGPFISLYIFIYVNFVFICNKYFIDIHHSIFFKKNIACVIFFLINYFPD